MTNEREKSVVTTRNCNNASCYYFICVNLEKDLTSNTREVLHSQNRPAAAPQLVTCELKLILPSKGIGDADVSSLSDN